MISRTFDNGLNDEIVKYIENAINATVEGVSYQEALKTAKQGVDQVFSKYQL
jgi:multiple sugar transport system substrate-binding protein